MYRPFTTNRFDKDLKRAAKRGKDLSKIKKIENININMHALGCGLMPQRLRP